MKATVIPCCVDPGLPAPEEGAGAAVRTELGWTAQHLVLGYAGSLSAWNRPEAVRNLYRRMRAIDDRTRLLVLTGDGPTAQAIFGAEDGVAVRSVPHAEVPRHLASIDLGLLLRNPSPVNRVASPVKFAEYLWCGAPVLVSAGVGDCTDLVRREGVGFVDEEGLPLTAILAELRARRAELRARCRAVAARRYSAARYDMALGWLLAGRSAATGPTGPPAEEPWA
jgi:glycosyltransferase involved in cell wall biosynthesis